MIRAASRAGWLAAFYALFVVSCQEATRSVDSTNSSSGRAAPNSVPSPSGFDAMPAPTNSGPNPMVPSMTPVPSDGGAVSPTHPDGVTLTTVTGTLPVDAVPQDVDLATGHILLSSFGTGLVEVDWPMGIANPTVVRQWPRQGAATFGAARYGRGAIYTNLYSQGLQKLGSPTTMTIGPAAGLISVNLLTILARANGEIWVAGAPTPVGGGGVQVLTNDVPGTPFLTQASPLVQSLGAWIEMPERASVFAATGAGVAELKSDGTFALVTTDMASISGIARQRGGTAVGAVGSGGVRRWNGQAFDPVAKHRPAPTSGAVSSSPMDIAIAADGTWFILYADGFLSILDPSGTYTGGFDLSDGVPSGAMRLLLLSDDRRVLVGGLQGLAVLTR